MNSKSDADGNSGSPPCYPSFEDWHQEIEGFSLRAERLNGPIEELRAAFEAGRSGCGISGDQPVRAKEIEMENDKTENCRDGCKIKRAVKEMSENLTSDYVENGGQRCDMQSGPCSCGAWH